MKRRPVFLDRDGVINEDISPYVCRFEDFRIFPYTIDALELLHANGFDVYVISNQQGVSLGLIQPGTLEQINRYLQERCAERGFSISGIYYCTDLKAQNSSWRKPMPGMILAARDEHELDLRGATMVGDKWSDIECGHRAGLNTILVHSGVTAPGESVEWEIQPDRTCATLLEAARLIVDAK
ncbi:MAG: D-glycero-alpha-D-manno-heptose-1,7-bisphosphate 7-phosphatase [Fimbriimonadaceae bacterium]|nr:D-glycero-alpha-D-manno-heptose-1,7-bisphosphate 7-phosphatase [Fimbriimonadaceae bacterium]